MTSTILLENERGQRLLTVEDLECLPQRLPSGPVLYELHNGVLVIMAPPGDHHSAAHNWFSYYLTRLGQLAGHGKARSGGALLLQRNPDTVLVPEAFFLTNTQLPYSTASEDYITTIPALVVEVRSKNDWKPEMDAKVKLYLDAGVEVVWFADPYKEIINIHRPGQLVQTLLAADTLTADELFPGFSVPVAHFFVK